MKKVFTAIIVLVMIFVIAKSYSPASGDVKMFIDNLIDIGVYSHTTDDFHGEASFYADEYHGRKTSNGEIFDQNKFTAAHKTLPFGTLVEVRNLKNNKSVIVKINDRGPFRPGRIIDLTKAAAKKIDMINDGIAEVELTIVK